jgi:hypothetical protein
MASLTRRLSRTFAGRTHSIGQRCEARWAWLLREAKMIFFRANPLPKEVMQYVRVVDGAFIPPAMKIRRR